MASHDFFEVHHDGEEEQRFDIENEEEQRKEVVTHLELDSCVTDGFHTAFVRSHLVLCLFGAVPEQKPGDGRRCCDERTQKKED